MKRVPILHIKDSSGVFGSERVILTLARNVDHERFAMYLVCMQHRDGSNEAFIKMARHAGMHVIPLNVNHRLQWSAVKYLRQVIQDYQIAILHTHDYKSDLYGLLASINLPVKRVLTSHGSTRDSLIKKLYLNFDERIIYPYYDRIIAVSEHLGKTLCDRKICSNAIRVIQNGLDSNLLDLQVPSDDPFASWVASIKQDGTTLIAVVGRLFPDKGHKFFLQAFKRLKIEHPNLKALIVGDGPDKEQLVQWINSHHLDGHVFICGFVSDMPAVYRAIDCLVIPSLTEGLPYTLLEAMYYNVPVIATSVGDIPCLIRPGITGTLMAPGDTEDIFIKLDEFIRNPANALRMASEGIRLVKSEFSAALMGRRLETLYLELIAAN